MKTASADSARDYSIPQCKTTRVIGDAIVCPIYGHFKWMFLVKNFRFF